jgi:hypothetical protein
VVIPKPEERKHIVELSGWLPALQVRLRGPSKYPGQKTALNYIWKEKELSPHPVIGENLKRCIKTYYDNTSNPEQEFWEYVRDLQKRSVI